MPSTVQETRNRGRGRQCSTLSAPEHQQRPGVAQLRAFKPNLVEPGRRGSHPRNHGTTTNARKASLREESDNHAATVPLGCVQPTHFKWPGKGLLLYDPGGSTNCHQTRTTECRTSRKGPSCSWRRSYRRPKRSRNETKSYTVLQGPAPLRSFRYSTVQQSGNSSPMATVQGQVLSHET